jgi:(1->4)-alpha-D-glucan 1-alpha-D-glucosylmutase
VTRFGLLNSLSQTLCKLAAPGVPDVYQGNELWDFSLVDPDNRRAVDYTERRRLLAELEGRGATLAVRELTTSLEDGRCKLWLIWKVLQLRRARPRLFSHGDYRRLRVRGACAHHVCAFARRCAGESLIAIVPRLYRRLLDDPARLPLGREVWQDTLVELPREQRAQRPVRNVLGGAELEPVPYGEGAAIPVAEALAEFPVALLHAGVPAAAAPSG